MKKNKFIWMKLMLTTLTILILLNLVLLLLPAALRSKNMPEAGGGDDTAGVDLAGSIGEEISDGENGKDSLGVDVSDGADGKDSLGMDVSDGANGKDSLGTDVSHGADGKDSLGTDVSDGANGKDSLWTDVSDSEIENIPNGKDEENLVSKDSGISAPSISDKASETAENDDSLHTSSGDGSQKSSEINPGEPANSENNASQNNSASVQDSSVQGSTSIQPSVPTQNASDADQASQGTAQSSSSEILIFPEPSVAATSNGTAFGDVDNNSDTNNTVTVCLMGDLMCLAGQQYTAERSDGSHDYTGSLYLLRNTFSSCDFVIGNLETTLSESNPYSTKEREVNEQPNCNAPADYLASLKWAGITHLVTANNHSLDGGLIGIEETIAHLDEYGIPHTGTYRADYSGAHYLMLEKNGIRIALLCFTELINQRELVTASQLSRIIDSYSRADAEKRIAQTRADGADFVIVYEHWGSENVHEVRAYQKSHAKEIAEAGADLIIGSHPHCLQKMEIISTQDGRSVPCFYSLGNVVSSMTRDINHDTVFVLVELQRNAEEVRARVTESPTEQQNADEPLGQAAQSCAEQPSQEADAETLWPTTEPQTEQSSQQEIPETFESGKVGIASLSLLACHVLTSFDGHYRVITPVNYSTDDKKAAAELAAAKVRIEEIFVPLEGKLIP